jgi:DNA end-binding protein Ku
MKATWSGMIWIGLVALPIRLYAATEERPVRLHEIHVSDGSRVEDRRFCQAENREVPYEQVGRGFALGDGRMVPLTDEDLTHLPLLTKRTVDVLGFVPFEDIAPISYGRPYYVGTLLWQDELRDPGDLASSTPVTDRELELAEVLIRELTGIDVGEVYDEYAHALEQLVDVKITGGELAGPAEAAPALDLMATLEESVRAAKRAHRRPSARARP